MKQIIKTQTIEKLFIPERTQPPHIGHIMMLESALENAKEVIVGIGSSNVIDERNPYSAYERELMLRKSIEEKGYSNYSFAYIPDFKTDDVWIKYIEEKINIKGATILTGNDYVQELFNNLGYKTIRPEELTKKPLIKISATELREMIINDNSEWKIYAAYGTKYYFEKFGGKDRISKIIPKEIFKYQKNIEYNLVEVLQ